MGMKEKKVEKEEKERKEEEERKKVQGQQGTTPAPQRPLKPSRSFLAARRPPSHPLPTNNLPQHLLQHPPQHPNCNHNLHLLPRPQQHRPQPQLQQPQKSQQPQEPQRPQPQQPQQPPKITTTPRTTTTIATTTTTASTTASTTKKDELEEFLEGLGLSNLLPIFRGEQIQMVDLRLLQETDFVALGLKLGPRRRILNALGHKLPN